MWKVEQLGRERNWMRDLLHEEEEQVIRKLLQYFTHDEVRTLKRALNRRIKPLRKAQLQELRLLTDDSVIVIEPHRSDAGTIPLRRNPMRSVLWRRNTPTASWQLIRLHDRPGVCLAFYGGAHRCFYGFTDEHDIRSLEQALRTARKWLRERKRGKNI